MITFACPTCGKKLQAKEEQAGKKAKCAHCQQVSRLALRLFEQLRHLHKLPEKFSHLLHAAAMLHDIALTDGFDSHRVSFEEAGGYLAWVFGVAAGWPADRAARVTEIIVRHMRDDVAATADPESHILQVATSWEIVGRRPEEFPAETRAEILAR